MQRADEDTIFSAADAVLPVSELHAVPGGSHLPGRLPGLHRRRRPHQVRCLLSDRSSSTRVAHVTQGFFAFAQCDFLVVCSHNATHSPHRRGAYFRHYTEGCEHIQSAVMIDIEDEKVAWRLSILCLQLRGGSGGRAAGAGSYAQRGRHGLRRAA